jgi:glycosyltransferase involved in cell wall biosynthesis
MSNPDSKLSVALVTRQSGETHFSIERLFRQLSSEFESRDVRPRPVVCPTAASGLLGFVRGFYSAWAGRADVNHIVGDVHYSALALPGPATVMTVHDLNRLDALCGVRKALYRLLYFSVPLRRCALVTTVSGETARKLLCEFPFVAAKLRVIRNCVREEFKPMVKAFNAARPRVLQVGTAPNKNMENVVRALKGEPCVLHIVGKLSLEQSRLLKSEGVTYESTAELSDADLVRAYQEADIVTFASLTEGFGLPILEAQGVGRALVTSSVSPMREIAGEGACCVDPGSPAAIRRGFRRLRDDERYRAAVIDAGLVNVERYRPGPVAEEYVAIYRELARKESLRRPVPAKVIQS